MAEEDGNTRVCVTVTSPEIECPLDSPSGISLTFSTISKTAGTGFHLRQVLHKTGSGCMISCDPNMTGIIVLKAQYSTPVYFFCPTLLVSRDDFAPYNMIVTFEECTSSLCVNIAINDDSTLEEEEEFDVLVDLNIEASQHKITLIQNQAMVFITDNEGKLFTLSTRPIHIF